MDRRVATVGAGLALAAFFSVGPARAQLTDSNAPIDITANEAEVINSKCVAIWRGAAEALQGKTRLRANTISVYSKPKPGASGAAGQPGCGATDRIEAEGQVYYVSPEQNARGDRAVYSASSDQIVITGDVIVVQGNNVARGDRLVIKVSTREARMESSAKGYGTPRRVRGVFYPEQSKPEGQAPAARP
jgi:lipopolysaccharide export system protein LptA